MNLFNEYLLNVSKKEFTIPGKKIILSNPKEFNPKILGMNDYSYGNLVNITGDISVKGGNFENLKGIKEINGILRIEDAYELKNLGDLEKVNQLIIIDCGLNSLGKLKSVRSVILRGCRFLSDLSPLNSVKYSMNIKENCPVKSLKNIIIQGDLYISEDLRDKIILPDRLKGKLYWVKNNFKDL